MVLPIRTTALPASHAYFEVEEKRADDDPTHSSTRLTSTSTLKEKLLISPPPDSSPASPDPLETPRFDPSSPPPPIPWIMVLLIGSINLNEAMQMNILWPFVPYMIRDFQIGSDNDIGFYGGLLGGSFFLAQLLSSFAWGVISDRVGRRFVLLYSTAAFTGATFVFGFASTYGVALAARFMAGFLSGSLGTAKVYLSEELDRRNHAKGFSALGFSAGLGGIIGPVVGGYLNRPAVQYPGVFSEDRLFGRYPYLLPELVSVTIGVVGFVVAIFYLPESQAYLARQRRMMARQAASTAAMREASVAAGASEGVTDVDAEPGRETMFSVMKRKQVLVCTGLYGLIALIFIIFDEILMPLTFTYNVAWTPFVSSGITWPVVPPFVPPAPRLVCVELNPGMTLAPHAATSLKLLARFPPELKDSPNPMASITGAMSTDGRHRELIRALLKTESTMVTAFEEHMKKIRPKDGPRAVEDYYGAPDPDRPQLKDVGVKIAWVERNFQEFHKIPCPFHKDFIRAADWKAESGVGALDHVEGMIEGSGFKKQMGRKPRAPTQESKANWSAYMTYSKDEFGNWTGSSWFDMMATVEADFENDFDLAAAVGPAAVIALFTPSPSSSSTPVPDWTDQRVGLHTRCIRRLIWLHEVELPAGRHALPRWFHEHVADAVAIVRAKADMAGPADASERPRWEAGVAEYDRRTATWEGYRVNVRDRMSSGTPFSSHRYTTKEVIATHNAGFGASDPWHRASQYGRWHASTWFGAFLFAGMCRRHLDRDALQQVRQLEIALELAIQAARTADAAAKADQSAAKVAAAANAKAAMTAAEAAFMEAVSSELPRAPQRVYDWWSHGSSNLADYVSLAALHDETARRSEAEFPEGVAYAELTHLNMKVCGAGHWVERAAAQTVDLGAESAGVEDKEQPRKRKRGRPANAIADGGDEENKKEDESGVWSGEEWC